jgi:flagellar hook-basal body complex protein FliE
VNFYNVLQFNIANIDTETINKACFMKEQGMEIYAVNIEMFKNIPMDICSMMVKNIGRNRNFLHDIKENRKGNNEYRKRMKDFKNMIHQEKKTVAKIIEDVGKKIDTMQNITTNDISNVIIELYPAIQSMDAFVQLQVLSGVAQYMTNVVNIELYLNKPEYKQNPKKLVCDMMGVQYDAIEGEVTVERN